MILTEKQAKEIIERALSYGSADELRVNLDGGRSGNTRFALNTITTSGDEDTMDITVTAYFGKRKASSSGNEFDPDSLKRLVKTAEELARVAPEDPEYVPELSPQQYLEIDPYFENTANADAAIRSKSALSSIEPASKKNLTAAGFFSHNHSFSAVGNNKKLWGFYRSTDASFTTTIRTADGSGSGWGGDNSRDIGEVHYAGASNRAIEKAEISRKPHLLEPGVYPVILEPRAAYDFLRVAWQHLSAREADEGRTYFAKAGGGNKLGEQVVGENITIRSDPKNSQLLGAPFLSNGQPAKTNVWIERGLLKQLSYDRYWAQKTGKEPTGPPLSMVLEGGSQSLEKLIAETDRAVLVTRFWYIRFVDPQTMLYTGLTRDGTFWIENGKIQHAVNNFRFNESPIAFLKNVTGLSKPLRVETSLMPAIRASAFTFSSLSQAV